MQSRQVAVVMALTELEQLDEAFRVVVNKAMSADESVI